MVIQGIEIEEIIVTSKNGEVLISLTDDNMIIHDSVQLDLYEKDSRR